MDGKKKVALVLTVLLALFFIVPNGLGKLFGILNIDVDGMAANFGYSVGFMKMIGGLELLGGIGLLVPQTRKLAALGLGGVMLGAIVTLVRVPAMRGMLPMPILVSVALFAAIKLGGGATKPVGD
jgi:putative oxidoreductase